MKENILETLCLSCMRDAGERFEICPFCGSPANIENQFHQLAPKSVLNGRFVVGKTLGQGGFGITYAGYDLTVGEKVAIKEFYPDGGVSRQKDLYTILPYNEEKTEELFTDGRAKFLKEAQKLVRFTNVDGIVQVKDYFEENGTAYIVMEYVEGPTLIQYLNKLGQPILPTDLYILLTPVFDALEQVHAQGILHRDISPDNIIVSPTSAKLLDFGAARDFSLLGEKSNTINIKAGYAPEEQYLTHGKQGPWTDVYALAATCYRAVTGKTPASSIERLSSDDLIPPSALSANVTPALEQVLLKGMAVRKENRYQSVKEFRDALNRAVNETSVPSPQPVYAAQPPSQQGYTAQPQSQQGYTAQPKSQQGYTAQPQSQQGYAAQPQSQQGYTAQPQSQQGYTAQPPSQQGYAAQPQPQYGTQQLNYSSSWGGASASVPPPQRGYGTPLPPYVAPPAPAVPSNKPTVSMALGIVALVFGVIAAGLWFADPIYYAFCIYRYGIFSDGSTLFFEFIWLLDVGFGIAAIINAISARKQGFRNGKVTAGLMMSVIALQTASQIVMWIINTIWQNT